MDTFQRFKWSTQQQLNRKLTTKEITFLQWIYTRHQEKEIINGLSINLMKSNIKHPPPFICLINK